ncbi:MAG: VOC family protein [Lachnospiraceae bacterium]
MKNKYHAKSISIITLGVTDVPKSIHFYEQLGWECSPDSDPAMCTFMLSDNIVLGLVPYEFLAKDACLPVSEKKPYNGFTLALNGVDEKEVDGLFELALQAGATCHQPPQWKDWGGYDGYSGYFLDPDGYPWEVACAPFIRLSEDNRLLPKMKREK